ncbi:hypothetical protein PTSG_01747 [Salpingoeca rosetta]|uniref:Uncharacterized protein n=1 Tax=Salpingoeca rosetta (strain ATCC 50818 / BSB-021) TaxID=946362 RepID=F2TYU6_SALR5|nr:uncharacterized protein PTSG_01747 [Salpingoeca rosetta]EGD78770.1 hypothetical protein PTSG_01747 [Salpingoeca rosetta]|eukprot:XP_004997726.1 hypothetical protein PTSG_01747 [Salpingoeca rosetta]
MLLLLRRSLGRMGQHMLASSATTTTTTTATTATTTTATALVGRASRRLTETVPSLLRAARRTLTTASATTAVARHVQRQCMAVPRPRSMLQPRVLLQQRAHMSTFQIVKQKTRRVLLISAGVAGVGVVGYLMFKTSSFMSSLTFKHVTYFGFYLGGITTGLAVVGFAILYRRYCGLHPEALYKDVLRRVSKTPVVVDKFGGRMSVGQFKAYAPTGGLILDTTKWLPRIKHEKSGLQMMFQLHGPKDSAMCSIEAQAAGASHKISSLALDFTDGQRFVLAGKPEDVVFKGLTKLR